MEGPLNGIDQVNIQSCGAVRCIAASHYRSLNGYILTVFYVRSAVTKYTGWAATIVSAADNYFQESLNMKYLVLIARLALGCLFIYASIHKVLDPADFSQAIRNYLILPEAMSNLAALILPWMELVAGSFLILGIQTRPSALITTGLLAVFIPVLFYVYYTGLDITCGCFSHTQSSGGKIGVPTLIRDSSIFLISLFVLLADRGNFRLFELFKSRQAQASQG